nr:MAG TPA: hypothetical protein [Caudoviricetes sp.]
MVEWALPPTARNVKHLCTRLAVPPLRSSTT